MKIKKLIDSDNAVVGIVAAFLIIGLIIAILSLIQTQYVPKWMEEREAEHMSQVADQFAQLKYAIDTHSVSQRTNTPISTSVTLGSKEMPYLMSVRAFGQLEIMDNAGSLTFTKNNSTIIPPYTLGSIKYSSSNAYFIDQTYTYEYGAVILSQSDGNTVVVPPSVSVKYEENVTINLTIANISTIGGKPAISGYGTYPIQTEFLSADEKLTISNISNLTIKTDYTNAWASFFNGTLSNNGLKYGTNYTISISTDKKNVTVNFTTNFIKWASVNVDLKIINIGAQIAPGWIVNTKS